MNFKEIFDNATDKTKLDFLKEIIMKLYNHKPVLRALRDEFKQAGVV
ncbi:hypothetical protein ES708_25174 [subsurface metagenome]